MHKTFMMKTNVVAKNVESILSRFQKIISKTKYI